MKTLHPKIQELKLRAKPVNEHRAYVDKDGNLVDFKIEVEKDRLVKGYLAVFGKRDSFGTIAVKGCFAKSIRERGPESTSKYKILLLWQHRMDEPIGQFTVLKEDDYGLYFEALLDDVPTAERALTQLNSGTLNQFSYGFNYLYDKMEYDDTLDAVLMYELELMEGSVVTRGSMSETYAIRSAEDFNNEKELLIEDTEYFIKSIPRSQQLQLRQLISRHISLSEIEPKELRQNSLEKVKPNPSKGFNLSEIIPKI